MALFRRIPRRDQGVSPAMRRHRRSKPADHGVKPGNSGVFRRTGAKQRRGEQIIGRAESPILRPFGSGRGVLRAAAFADNPSVAEGGEIG
jgi:hypothetical protein